MELELGGASRVDALQVGILPHLQLDHLGAVDNLAADGNALICRAVHLAHELLGTHLQARRDDYAEDHHREPQERHPADEPQQHDRAAYE